TRTPRRPVFVRRLSRQVQTDGPRASDAGQDRPGGRHVGAPADGRVSRTLRSRDGISGDRPRRLRQHGATVPGVRRALRLLSLESEMTRTTVRLAALLLVSFIVACQRSGPEVVVYTSEDQVFSEPILKDFEKSTGIKVRAVYDTEETKSTGVALRIVAERDHPQADVFWANEPLRPVMLQQQGLLEAYRSPNSEDIPDRYRDVDGYWTGFAARARVIIYNTNVVKAADAPGSVEDLASPRWKGKVGLANPLFGTTTTQLAALFALWGEPGATRFLESVKANGVKLVTSNGEAKDLVASGELAWAFTDTDDA